MRKIEMYQIPIDDVNYHVNAFTPQEREWGRATFRRVALRYKNFSAFVEKTLQPLRMQDEAKKELLVTVTLAFCHVVKVSFPVQNEAELDRTVKAYFHSFLPVIAENLLVVHTTHPVQFEPIVATGIYVSHVLQSHLYANGRAYDFETLYGCLMLEWSALFRSLRSVLLLVSCGDDVHGMALLRGAFEIVCKLTLAKKFPDEYVLFKKFNLYLQQEKNGGIPIPTEMAEYLAREPAYKKNKENFLAYGWAKDKKGRRILKMSDLLREVSSSTDLMQIFRVSSEFVHEDYVGVGYDYIAIRKYLTDICFFFYTEVLSSRDGFDFLPEKVWKRILHLLRLSASTYAGDFPLDQPFLK